MSSIAAPYFENVQVSLRNVEPRQFLHPFTIDAVNTNFCLAIFTQTVIRFPDIIGVQPSLELQT